MDSALDASVVVHRSWVLDDYRGTKRGREVAVTILLIVAEIQTNHELQLVVGQAKHEHRIGCLR